MTHERLERQLRHGRSDREERYLPRTLPASAAEARAMLDRGSSPRWLLATATAAAVVAAVGWAGWLAVQPGTRGPGSGNPPTVTPTPSSHSTGIGACGADDLVIASDAWDAGAGSRGTTVVVRIAGSTASCVLPRAIEAHVTDGSGAELVRGASEPASTVEAAGGTQLELGVSWSNWCGPTPPGPLVLSLRLSADGDWMPIVPAGGAPIPVPPCMGAGQASFLNVTGFEASTRPPIEG